MTLKIGSGILRDDLIESNENKNIANGYAGLNANAKLAIAQLPTQYTSPQQTITTSGALTLAHGLGAVPSLVNYHLVCLTAEAGYAVGDVVDSAGVYLNGAAIWKDATNIYLRFSNGVKCYYLFNKTTGASGSVTNTYWGLVVHAWVQ